LVSAVILVNTDFGEENKVLENIKSIRDVEEAYSLWGVYDLMVKVKSSSLDDLKETVTSGLRQVEGVSSVLTLMIDE
jgi:DNA-binding Lrp family transcriptional regulator